MKVNICVIFISLSLLMVGCKPSEHDKALSLIKETKHLIAKNDENSALLIIDSIHISYPKDILVRRMADTLKWGIELHQTERSLPHIDSLLISLNDTISVLTKKFKYIKNEDYQDYGSFEHRVLRTENNTRRCYIKPITTEKGGFSITSYYIGNKAQHNQMRVSANDMSVETLEASESDISQFKDIDTFHEIILFEKNSLNGVDKFIFDNINNRIKITLLGNKQPYNYYLNKNEKDIFAQTYKLAVKLNDFYKLTDQQLRMTQKVEVLKKRLNIE